MSAPSHSPDRARWIWALLAVFALAAGLGLREPSPPDEPRFALAAQTMVESGQWLVPHRGQELYAEKPPPFMWAQAAALAVSGNLEVAFLLPSLLAALLTLVLVRDLARRLWTPDVARSAVAALFVCVQFGLQAKRGQIDMLLVGLTTLSLWALLRFLLLNRAPRWLWLGMFAAGVGTVTKGVGFLPILVLLPWLLLGRPKPAAGPTTPAWIWLAAPLAFVAGTAVWLGPLLTHLALQPDPELTAYTQELLFRQTAERYANAWHHLRPWWYYLQVIFTLWLPGALLLPWLLPLWLRRLRERDPATVLLIGWSMLVLLFFSVSPGKREVYIFPALPALCLAAAPWLPELLRRRGVQIALTAYLALMTLLLVAAPVAALGGWSPWAERLAAQREVSAEDLRGFLLWLLAVGISGCVALAVWRMQHIGRALILFTAVLWSAYGFGLAPALDASSSAHQIMQRVGRQIGRDAELGLVAWREQYLLQADRPAAEFGFKQPWHEQWAAAANWAAGAPGRRWLFVLDEALSPCVDRSQLVAAGSANRRDWWLVPGAAIAPGCVTPPFPEPAEEADPP